MGDTLDLKVIIVVVTLALFAGTHATLIQGIRQSAPNLVPKLGWFGPLYWLGLFWWRPAYRRFLNGGQFDAELSAHPNLLRLAQAERLLWYLSLLAIVAAIVL
jgi:hypothetical protein